MDRNKQPLYRRVNTQTHGVHRHANETGGNFRTQRQDVKQQDGARSAMRGKNRGLDFTPLYRFLLSKVGCAWDEVYGEAISRLPPEGKEQIFRMVALREDERQDVVRFGESTYFSGLFVDEQGILQVVDPSVTASTMEPSCGCCTHTLNGVVLTKKWLLPWP